MCTSLDLIRVRNQSVHSLRFILLTIRELSDSGDVRVFSNTVVRCSQKSFVLICHSQLQLICKSDRHLYPRSRTHVARTPPSPRVCACGLTADAATARNLPPGCDPAPDVITPPGRSWCIGNLATLSSRLLRRKGSANLTTWKALNVSQRALYGVE